MNTIQQISGYKYANADSNDAHSFLLPDVLKILSYLCNEKTARLFDLGCGNGAVAHHLSMEGWAVQGVDPSEDGIRFANLNYPRLNLRQGSAYDDLAAIYGTFPIVISLEVVEHVYDPRKYAACVHALLENDGVAIISTPYHGYIKNLALAMTGRLDAHFTALWDYGHIKFWSQNTLSQLLKESGFRTVAFRRVGRIPCLAKSMIAIARK